MLLYSITTTQSPCYFISNLRANDVEFLVLGMNNYSKRDQFHSVAPTYAMILTEMRACVCVCVVCACVYYRSLASKTK